MALVLARNVGQRIFIGDDIVITVERIRGQQASIAIDAPKDITVHREEVVEKIKREGYHPPIKN